jgi:ketosteroid isomerase-like protein
MPISHPRHQDPALASAGISLTVSKMRCHRPAQTQAMGGYQVEDAQGATTAMREVNRIFEEDVCQKKNFDALAQVYTQDAAILPPGGDIITGLEKIKQFWFAASESLKITSARLNPHEVQVAGDFAYEVARGEVGTENGPVPIKYIVIWKMEDGTWKWHRDIWNMNG